MLPIADPKLSTKFLEEIKLHYKKADDKLEMQQEKLWILATSAMPATMMVKWLQRWNSSEAIKLPTSFQKVHSQTRCFCHGYTRRHGGHK